MNTDEEHLRLLSIFHDVVGGLAALFACFPIIHLIIGLAMLSGALENNSGEAPPAVVGLIFIMIPAILMPIGWAVAVCIILAGRSLVRRTHYIFCLVMAGVSCAFMPFGTVLGVFAIIVLMRPSVKELFTAAKQTPEPA